MGCNDKALKLCANEGAMCECAVGNNIHYGEEVDGIFDVTQAHTTIVAE